MSLIPIVHIITTAIIFTCLLSISYALLIAIMKATPNSKVQSAKVLLQHGLSTREIAKRLDISHMTVARIRASDKGDIPVPKAGRPCKVSKVTKRVLRRKYDTGDIKRHDIAQRLVQDVEKVRVHTRTIRNYLDMKAYVVRKQLELSKDDKKARYQFAKDHLHWTVDQWKNVIFSDEMFVKMVGSFGRQFYYKKPESKAVRPHHIKGTVQGGRGKMLLWGCLTYWGPGDLSWIEGNMDAETYVDVLDSYILPTVKYYGMNRKTMLFQQDNASSHTASKTKKFLRKARISVIDWPVRSPDLNIIENVWAYMQRRLYECDTPPESMQELWEKVQDIWVEIPTDYIRRLYESLPDRIKAVYKSRGGHCHY